jgi:hypothetical protein
MFSRVARATDSIFMQRVAAQDVNQFLGRSDYPHMYDPDELQDAFDDGWHHFLDEPDLLHKTDRGMTFSISPTPHSQTGNSYYMKLHNPEGVSREGRFSSLPEAMQVQKDVATNPGFNMKEKLQPDPWQGRNVSLLNKAREDGGTTQDEHGYDVTEQSMRDYINKQKASEEAIAAGGEDLYGNLMKAHERRRIWPYDGSMDG